MHISVTGITGMMSMMGMLGVMGMMDMIGMMGSITLFHHVLGIDQVQLQWRLLVKIPEEPG